MNNFYKHQLGGCKTLLSTPTTGINRSSNDIRNLTPEQLAKKVEEDNYWADKRREREEWA